MSTVTYTEGGVGRKNCPCGVFVPARVSTCPKCGHVFVSKLAEERSRTLTLDQERRRAVVGEPSVVAVTVQRRDDDQRNMLVVGSGLCPVPLEGTDLAVVQAWASSLCDAVPGFRVSRSAARHWARQFFSWDSEEFRTVSGHLPHCRSLCEP